MKAERVHKVGRFTMARNSDWDTLWIADADLAERSGVIEALAPARKWEFVSSHLMPWKKGEKYVAIYHRRRIA